MPGGSKFWCFTWNNPDDASLPLLQQLHTERKCTYLIVGRETAPRTGTPHLQCFIAFAERQRFSDVRLLLPTCHLESCRGTPQQNREYCTKCGDYLEYGSLPSGPGRRSDWESFRDWCESQPSVPSERRIMEEWPSLWGRYPSATLRMAATLSPRQNLREGALRQWQADLCSSLDAEPDDRGIVFVVDSVGGIGKSWFCGYLFSRRDDVQLLAAGKRDDLAFAVDVTKRVFLINLARGQLEFLQYSVLEALKDRMIMSPKYQSQMKILMHTPHVVVFTNEEPDLSKMTEDRYVFVRPTACQTS